MPKFQTNQYYNAERYLKIWKTSTEFAELPGKTQRVLRSNLIHWFGDILEDERSDIAIEIAEISRTESNPATKQLLNKIADKIKQRGRD
jgi:hypothetical protein